MKSKNSTVLWSVLLLLAGGLFLAGFYLKDGDVLGPAFLFLCALFFFGGAIRSKKGWWAIIPGGLIGSIGFVSVLETIIPHEDYPFLQNTLEWGVFKWVLMLGWSVTFGYLWSLTQDPAHRVGKVPGGCVCSHSPSWRSYWAAASRKYS